MFNITNFIMSALIGMIGNYPDFQVRQYALNWYEKGKLTEENLEVIETLIELENEEVQAEDVLQETETTEELTEEPTEDYTEYESEYVEETEV